MSKYDILPGPFASQAFTVTAIGPLVIGSLLNIVLLGFGIAQLKQFLSSKRFERETRTMKALVYSVSFLAIIQTLLQSWLIYHYSISQNRTADVIFAPTLVEKINTVPVGIEAALVQTYLAHRCGGLFKSRRNRIICFVVLGLFMGAGLFGAILYCIGSFTTPSNPATSLLPPILNISTALWLFGCCFADIGTSGGMIILLRKRMYSGFNSRTDSMIRMISVIALSSSVATALFSSVPAIIILAFSTDALNAGLLYAFVVPLSSLYFVCLLVNLNLRDTIRAKGEGGTNTFKPSVTTPGTGYNDSSYQLDQITSMKRGFEGIRS